MRFSRRTDWRAAENAITLRRRELETAGTALRDLTNSNPTAAGLDLPTELLAEILAESALAPYEPQPLGLRSAREALADYLSREEEVSSDDVVLAASTSEAYSWLFKLLTDPGENVATGVPSYPLLDSIASLESVELRRYALDRHHGWQIDRQSLQDAVDGETRALVAVHPNNPTGSIFDRNSSEILRGFGLPVISDEVFIDYPVEAQSGIRSLAIGCGEGLVFVLGGLSKSAALPHWKLGWIRVAGDPQRKREAIRALELIADTYLSVAAPVQKALPQILEIAPEIQSLILERAKKNLVLIDALLATSPSIRRMRVDAGWSVVLRVPSIESDEQTVLKLLDAGVIVQPGYFFDYETEGHLVISLLTEEQVLRDGLAIVLAVMANQE